MNKIEPHPRSIRQLLTGTKYTVHYYQREYRWGKKQIEELLEDLENEFMEFYQDSDERSSVKEYGHYFMGSIVISASSNDNAIIDGQQRLSSITLLLIYLNYLQSERDNQVDIKNLIFSEQYGEKSFNINVEERLECMEAIYNSYQFNPEGKPESVRNLYARYQDIEEIFPETLKGEALPYFIDWLIDKVLFVDIQALTEQDAQKIFVTMNDRGLSLTPTEMLKGYLLSEISDDKKRNRANELWKNKILELKDLSKEEEADFIKNWLRAQYAETIRETKKGAIKEDFDIIGTTFHKWVRENKGIIGLNRNIDFERFVLDEFAKFADSYLKLRKSSIIFNPEYEFVYYNASRNFTFQSQVIMASFDPNDPQDIIDRKIKTVSCFLDQYIAIRVFNFKTVDYSSIRNAMFNLTKKIRRMPLNNLIDVLKSEINEIGYDLNGIDRFYLNGFTKRYMLHILARITYHVEKMSKIDTNFEQYVERDKSNPYDIEHIWSDNYDRHRDEFQKEEDFQYHRNKFGGLILLPKDKNRSYQDKTYEEKLEMYFSDNLLARTLNAKCYMNNPSFLSFIQSTNLLFKPYTHFKNDDLNERQCLYKEICRRIWNVNELDKFIGD